MAGPYKVKITIKAIGGSGRCSQGLKVGDTWLIEKNITPSNFCMTAFNAVYPPIRTLRYGGETPYGEREIVGRN